MNRNEGKPGHLALVHSSAINSPMQGVPSVGDLGSIHAEPEAINILLVEDNPADRRLVAERLGNHRKNHYQLIYAERLSEALQALAQNRISVILLDLQLPDCRDLESLSKIHTVATGIPIVVISEIEDESLALKALQLGAQDFLVKWHTNEHLLVRAVQYALERKQVEEHLYHLAHHDSLTGLPNRKHFYDQLKKAIAMARRDNRLLAIMFLDLGDFKKVNDRLGHHCGDLLLQTVSRRLFACVRETDCLARMGGDEFIIAFTISRPEDATAAANKVLDVFAEPFMVDGRELHTRASIGISIYPADGEDMESLIRNSDTAMYRAKAEGSDISRYRFYSPGFNAKTAELVQIEERLHRALANQEFAVYYQPQVDIHHGNLVGMEALIRWEHPERGLLIPAHFMQTFEETGFMVHAGAWMLREACKQNKAWQNAGHPPVIVAVNISGQELRHKDFTNSVREILEETGLEPRWLELEIREQSISGDENLVLARLSEIAALGVRIALDNLGHSHIPLSFLTHFPIHAIKIDRSIVSDVATDANHAAVAKAVIAVARVLNIKGLAEGVETPEQLDFFKAERCNDAQGYMFGKPLPPLDCTELMSRLKNGSYQVGQPG
ncbi:MAG: EAL domain-containing protein [Nitrosomonadales bacterium]|nr:EAL domain-containing protein [Nitrosomonadales bacterium]